MVLTLVRAVADKAVCVLRHCDHLDGAARGHVRGPAAERGVEAELDDFADALDPALSSSRPVLDRADELRAKLADFGIAARTIYRKLEREASGTPSEREPPGTDDPEPSSSAD